MSETSTFSEFVREIVREELERAGFRVCPPVFPSANTAPEAPTRLSPTADAPRAKALSFKKRFTKQEKQLANTLLTKWLDRGSVVYQAERTPSADAETYLFNKCLGEAMFLTKLYISGLCR